MRVTLTEWRVQNTRGLFSAHGKFLVCWKKEAVSAYFLSCENKSESPGSLKVLLLVEVFYLHV